MKMPTDGNKKGRASIAELKGAVYELSGSQNADQYSKTTKAIGEYAGRTFGHDMKKLVLQLVESQPVEPEYPKEGSGEKERAIWSKRYDLYLKREERYKDQKGKLFTIVVGQCTKLVRNRVEGLEDYGKAEASQDVIAVLRMIKDVVFNANEKKYAPMQAIGAWTALIKVRQQDGEELEVEG